MLLRGGSVFASAPIVYGSWPLIYNTGNMRIGRRCIFRTNRFRPSLTALDGGLLEIGDNAFINDGANICATISIRIGNYVKIADMVYVYDTDFHPVSADRPTKRKPVIIGNNVWIGANAVVLAGAEIGDHSVIGAGSIVTGKIPSRCVAAGNPARVIKQFDAPDNWVRD